MNNGYYQATGAMVTQFNRLNVVSNNLANVNTIGYKRDDVVIADFERIFKDIHDELPIKNHTKQAASFLNRSLDRVPVISEEFTDFTQAGFKHTDNPLDFSIKREDLFFLVQTNSGQMLTKNGSFTLDNEGYIVTKEGYRVLDQNYATQPQNQRGIQVPQDTKLTADQSGNLYANGEQINSFAIVQPRDLKDLRKIGDNLFTIKNEGSFNVLTETNSVIQGYTQMSNVNPVTEMVALIETNRMVDMYQKVMNTHMNDINQDAISKIGTVKS